MLASWNQFATTTQFFLYGRSRFTRSGWEKASKDYEQPDILSHAFDLCLSDRIYIVTGANAGIGKEISKFLAYKGAVVYMVCRNPERGNQALEEIISTTKNQKVYLLIGNCGAEFDVRRIWYEFLNHCTTHTSNNIVRLDGLLCNAGALLNEKTFTTEGVETTFATHLLFGVYLLGSLALSTLNNTPHSRLVVVSSGGMYNTKLPDWDELTSTGNKKYDGQLAYAYAKRGQVLLCEEWSKLNKHVKIVSCHPGWTLTPGLESAYGRSKSYLEPLRDLWQGAEGIVWLLVAPSEKIISGSFYLDRSPQVKHISGPFFTEGYFSKNSDEEIKQMMNGLEQWSNVNTRPSLDSCLKTAAKNLKLVASNIPLDLNKFISGDWYVLANIPTLVEIGASNYVEKYSLRPSEKDNEIKIIDISCSFFPKGSKTTAPFSDPSTVQLKGTVLNSPINTHWSIDPKMLGFHLPIGLNYLILEVGEIDGNDFAIIGIPERTYLWIMIRMKPSECDKIGINVMEYYNIEDKKSINNSFIKNNKIEKLEHYEIDKVKKGMNSNLSKIDRIDMERKVLIHAINFVEELGYDVKKIQRVPWIEILSLISSYQSIDSKLS